MSIFHYTARDIHGEEITGEVKARDVDAATAQLHDRGLFPSEVRGMDLIVPPSKRPSFLARELPLPSLARPINTKRLMVLTRQLATLLHAGLPLLRALQSLERQQPHKASRTTLAAVSDAIEGGSTFAAALAEHPRVFNRFYVNMAKAGEAGGMLDRALASLADRMEKTERVRTRLKTAMTYPIVVLTASAAILVFMMVAIIPRFEEIFEDLLEGRALPTLTLFVMGVSENLARHWPLWLGAIGIFAAGIGIANRFQRGRRAFDGLKLATPYLGGLVRHSALGRIARSLGTLMEAGVPILRALAIAKETEPNSVMGGAVQKIHDAVQEGRPVATPAAENRVFPPVFVSMVEVGEETGDLPGMLLKTADMYEEEVDGAVAALGSVIEPALIVLLAVVVGTIVIAMFLPMVSIIGNLS